VYLFQFFGATQFQGTAKFVALSIVRNDARVLRYNSGAIFAPVSPSLMTPEFLIEHFRLEPLPVEGGLFHLYYRSAETVAAAALPPRYARAKNLGSAILYLHLAAERAAARETHPSAAPDHPPQPPPVSLLHRLTTDEIYHFYRGDPVTLLLLFPDGHFETRVLGAEYENGQAPVCVVPRGVWQGSCLQDGGQWALLGCTLAPAYDDQDFELGARDALCAQYPDAADLIRRLTRP